MKGADVGITDAAEAKKGENKMELVVLINENTNNPTPSHPACNPIPVFIIFPNATIADKTKMLSDSPKSD